MGRGHRLVPVDRIKERVTEETRLKDLVDDEGWKRRSRAKGQGCGSNG